ncbi:MAG: hypothetical protein AAGI37_03045 [Planctomycetota bacterium]
MTPMLSQPADAGPPGLPGKTAMRVDTALGAGAVLHAFDTDQPVLHARWLFRTDTAGAGSIAIAGGIDPAGLSGWQLWLDTDPRQVRLGIGGAQLVAELPDALAWHCVEVRLDAADHTAGLHLNGVERDAQATPLNPTRYVWLGAAFPADGFVGTIDFDRWALSTQPIGVPLAKPTADHAGDPRRWLAVYNRTDADSCAWADTYRHRRGLPYANLCGLDLPTSETIGAASFEAMRQQINAYLDDNRLRGQVVGVLLGLNVPGYADLAGQDTPTPIASYLHTDDPHGLPVVNPLYRGTITQRPTAPDFAGVRLTGRIDAASLADAVAMIDRADALTADPLAHDQGADLLIDLNPDNPDVGPVYTQPVADWANGIGSARLRLPKVVYDGAAPTAASNDAVLWGWRDAAPPADFFGPPAGRRAACLQFAPGAEPAVTARDPLAADWLSRALYAGYAYAAAPSRAYSLSALPLPHLFFEALRQGWTVAEAWLVAKPFLRDALQIVGDPLMPVPFPKSGYDVFGPAPRLDAIDFESPLAVLHAGERGLPLAPSDLPDEHSQARYLVRRFDEQGRPDHASASVLVSIAGGTPFRPAPPAWPTEEGWPALQRGGKSILSAHWPASLRSLGVGSVQLESQAGTEPPATANSTTPQAGQRAVSFSIDHPTQPTRYRITAVQGDAVINTPWSAVVAPAAAPGRALTVLEASS